MRGRRIVLGEPHRREHRLRIRHGAARHGETDLGAPGSSSARTPTNVFRDATYVFVPYCTGDLHAGDNVATYDVGGTPTPTYHWGGRNLDPLPPRVSRPGLPGVRPSVARRRERGRIRRRHQSGLRRACLRGADRRHRRLGPPSAASASLPRGNVRLRRRLYGVRAGLRLHVRVTTGATQLSMRRRFSSSPSRTTPSCRRFSA